MLKGVKTCLVLCVAVVACSAPMISLRPSARGFTYRDYDSVYERWTRSADDFSFAHLSDVLHATATFESWEFRWAYQARYAYENEVSPADYEIAIAKEKKEAATQHRFFITMLGNNYRESDMTSPRHAWRVLLMDAKGHQTWPAEIQKIAFPTPTDKVYFPSVSPQRMTFRVIFPAFQASGQPSIDPSARYVVLRFVGPEGPKVDLRWDVAP